MSKTRWLVVWFEAPGWPTGERRQQYFNSEAEAKKWSQRVDGCVRVFEPKYGRR